MKRREKVRKYVVVAGVSFAVWGIFVVMFIPLREPTPLVFPIYLPENAQQITEEEVSGEAFGELQLSSAYYIITQEPAGIYVDYYGFGNNTKYHAREHHDWLRTYESIDYEVKEEELVVYIDRDWFSYIGLFCAASILIPLIDINICWIIRRRVTIGSSQTEEKQK